MGILSWAILGLLAGILAKVIMPGKQGGGFIATAILGVAGAFVGGFVGSTLGLNTTQALSGAGIATATGGALLLLLGQQFLKKA